MRAKEYEVLVQAVEQGVASGWRRAYKHDDAPLVEDMQRCITDAVLNSICEWFVFEPFTHDEGE